MEQGGEVASPWQKPQKSPRSIFIHWPSHLRRWPLDDSQDRHAPKPTQVRWRIRESSKSLDPPVMHRPRAFGRPVASFPSCNFHPVVRALGGLDNHVVHVDTRMVDVGDIGNAAHLAPGHQQAVDEQAPALRVRPKFGRQLDSAQP